MTYPDDSRLTKLVELIHFYGQLQHDYGAPGVAAVLAEAEQSLQDALEKMQALPADAALARKEPNDLGDIQQLRPVGPRRLWRTIDVGVYREKLAGALLGRFAGCTLGSPVEFWTIERMAALARENGEEFPPLDYWQYVPYPYELRYALSPRQDYTRLKMDGVPVDDDLAYTLLGLGAGFLLPGIMAGASLAVGHDDQGVAAGLVSASQGIGFIIGPAAIQVMHARGH